MRNGSVCSLVIFSFLSSSCASTSSWSGRDKTLASMMGAGAVGGVIGAVTAPKTDSVAAQALLWGGVSAALAGVVGLFVWRDDQRADLAEKKVGELEREIEEFKGEMGPELISEGNATGSRALPASVSHLVRPGSWRLYKLSRWEEQGENTLVHHDKMLVFNPPTLTPGAAPKTSPLTRFIESKSKQIKQTKRAESPESSEEKYESQE
jgi:hypothetical protein